MMMTLGFFVFSLDTAAYEDLQRQTAWQHPANARVGLIPARQFTGKGDESVTLSGRILPELRGTPRALDALRAMGDTGRAWPLIEGTGKIYGVYVITDLAEGNTIFFKDGAARRYDFTLTLQRVDDSRLDQVTPELPMTAGLVAR